MAAVCTSPFSTTRITADCRVSGRERSAETSRSPSPPSASDWCTTKQSGSSSRARFSASRSEWVTMVGMFSRSRSCSAQAMPCASLGGASRIGPPASDLDLGLGDEVGEAELARGHVAEPELVEHHLHPHQVADAGEERQVVERLRQEVVGPGLQPADPLLGRVEGGHHDHGNVRGLLGRLERGADGESVHVRHHHVEHHHVGLLAPRQLQRLGAVFGDNHVVIGRGQLGAQQEPVGCHVVHNQHSTRHPEFSLWSVISGLLKPRRTIGRICVNEWFRRPEMTADQALRSPGCPDLAGRRAGGAGAVHRRRAASRQR